MENRLYMLSNQSHTQMMGFIITEESGKVIVIDGGNAQDGEHLLEVLREATGHKRVIVDAWLFTHAHSDHMDAFYWLMENRRGFVDFDRIYCCFPSEQYLATEEPRGGARTLRRFNEMSGAFIQRVTTVSVDDVYQVGTVKIEVLFTVDAHIKTNVVNNSSTVFRIELGGKSLLFLGDLGEEGGDILKETRPDKIVCDYCQMAHHGQGGVKKSFYQAAHPRFCLWCAPQWLWNNDNSGKGFDTDIFQTVRTREWMDEIGYEKHYVTNNGDVIIDF